MSRRIALAVAVTAALAAGVVGATAATSGTPTVPHIKHVFIVVLENENADSTFGPDTQIPYLAQTLTSQGAFVPNYYATGHLSLDNYISMVSGQGPNVQTQADCQVYTKFLPGVPTANGQFIGQGCVYGPGVQNIATQLEGNGYTWKGYMQDMANSAPAQPSTCRHPAFNSQDSTQSATATDQYASRHNPFVYFESIIDFPTCQANDVDLSRLSTDLASASTTPDYAFITPDLCNDGHDTPCPDGQPGGMAQANTFLKGLVPQILASPAYKDHGLLMVTFDEAEGDPQSSNPDASACCGEQPGPNTVNAGGPIPGPGGGRIGAVVLSPCIKPGTVTTTAYNHYSLLRSVEDNFGLPHLGFAGQSGLQSFDAKILNKPTC
jgi:phosphatidylinositol-3-phosphatase